MNAPAYRMDVFRDAERARVTTGLQRMSLDAGGDVADHKSASVDVTRGIKGAKVVEIAIAALTRDGYPAPARNRLRRSDTPTWW